MRTGMQTFFSICQYVYYKQHIDIYHKYHRIDKSNGKIVIIDAEDLSFTYIAKDENSFLAVLTLYMEYSALGRFSNESLVLDFYRDKCIELAGGESYAHVYGFFFPSAEDKV